MYEGVASEVAWAPDGQYLASVLSKADLSGYSLFVYESDNSEPLLLSEDLDVYPWGIAWSPDSRWIAFSGAGRDDNLDVYVVNVETGERQRLTTNPARDYDPVWFPSVTTSEETNP
jgi:Tol biopolymer transport system component